MFNNLLESKAKKQRRAGGGLMSILVHAGVVAALIVVTKNAGIINEKPKEEKVDFVEVKKDEPKPPEPEKPPPPPDVVAAPPPPKGFQVLSAPIEIPNVIPEIDLSKKVTDEADFSGKGVAGGIAKGVEGGKGPVVQNNDQPFYDFQVEKPVVMAPGSQGPAYPDMLRTAGIEGTVLAQFVVDTTGRADMSTYKALKSDNDLFTTAVKNALQRMRFLPAEVGGRKVKQLVQQPFQFSLNR
jgi:periplasmic protein TonB